MTLKPKYCSDLSLKSKYCSDLWQPFSSSTPPGVSRWDSSAAAEQYCFPQKDPLELTGLFMEQGSAKHG